MLAITTELAHRLEFAEALDGVECAEALAKLDPDAGAAVQAAAGGFLTYLGPSSPLTHALGVALTEPVTAAQLDAIEAFYRARQSSVTVDVSPYADPTLTELLSARGYRFSDFSNVMVRRIWPAEIFYAAGTNVSVREASADDVELWSGTTIRGFFGRDSVSQEEARIGRILFQMVNAKPLIATILGEPAGTASATFRNRVASCFADSTLVRFRRRGVHHALILARLRMAVEAGCDVMTAGTQPGSASQRDYERLGFQVAYTKITMTRD